MKKLLVATVAVIGLVGCTVEDTGSSSNNTPSKPAPSASSSVSDEDIYVMLVRAEYNLGTMSDYELVSIARNLCSAIDDGLTVPGLALLAMEYGVDAEMLGFITGAGISAFCPWNNGFFDGY